MTTTSDPKDDLIFLGINFNNFFKSCACLQKRKDNDSVSSASGKNRPKTEQRKKFEDIPETANVPNDETHSIASSTDWADLEEISFPADPTLGAPLFDHNDTVSGNLMEDFTTQEPIDFESLKELTGVKEEDDDERSNKSGLSKGSKKIAKNQGAPHASKFAPKDKDLKNEKGKRKPWQPHEDAKVLELVGRYGQSWAVVATMMEGRTGKQIRDRYLNKLRPNIRRGEWTNEEDRILLSCYYQIGHKWSKIATYLPGRTEGQVKNRFYSHIKKKILTQDGDDSMGESPEQNYIGNYNGAGGMEVEGRYNNYGVRHNLREMSPNVAYQEEYVKSLPSPSGSSGTTGTTATNSYISTDRDVNSMLDKMVGFMDKKNEMMQQDSGLDLSKLSMDDRMGGMGYNTGSENFDNMAKVERFDELQKRKNKLEFLLAQTLKDMGGVNAPNAGLI